MDLAHVYGYTYDSANRLVEVSEQSSVTSLSYNGLGQRLSMDAAGVIAHYVLDGNQPLTAESTGNTTFFLYGRGPIGEKTTTWNYSLSDGTNTPRQLSDDSGDITLSARYTPWGDTLETNGTGNFTFGYIGGILDATTGLLYVGNGQYYDPTTGRFLTRGVNPDSTNPYVPWNPIGAVIGPLALFSLVARRKKGKGNPYLLMLFMLVVLPLSVGMACDIGGETPLPTQTAMPISTTELPPATATNIIPTATEAPTQTPTPCDGCDSIPTATPTPGLDDDIIFSSGWTETQKDYAMKAILAVGGKLAPFLDGIASTSAFLQAYNVSNSTPFTFLKMEDAGTGCAAGRRLIKCHPDYNIQDSRVIVHELGHALHHSRYDVDTQGPYGSLDDSANAITDNRGNWVTGTHPGGVFERTTLGYVSNGIPDMYHGEAEYPTSWDSNLNHEARNEDFADMYMNWVYDSFDYSSEAYGAGVNRFYWINDRIAGWIQ